MQYSQVEDCCRRVLPLEAMGPVHEVACTPAGGLVAVAED